MEGFITNALVQAACLSPESWTGICNFWQWTFWVGFFAGLVGFIVNLFMKPIEGL